MTFEKGNQEWKKVKNRKSWNKGLTGFKGYWTGKKHSDETKLKIKIGNLNKKRTDKQRNNYKISKLGIKNPMWKKENVGYTALHNWIRRNKPKTELCEACLINPPKDLANISGKYKRDINDFQWICRKCHMYEDGRINNLKQFQEAIYVLR